MSGYYGERSEVYDSSYVGTRLTVGTSQVEAKVGATRDPERQLVILYNDSSNVVYYGPTGVSTSGVYKGFPLEKKQEVAVPIGDLGVYLIADSASNYVLCQEIG